MYVCVVCVCVCVSVCVCVFACLRGMYVPVGMDCLHYHSPSLVTSQKHECVCGLIFFQCLHVSMGVMAVCVCVCSCVCVCVKCQNVIQE